MGLVGDLKVTHDMLGIRSRTRILFVDHCKTPSGGVVCLYNLIKAMDRNRFEAVVLIGGENHLTHELRRLDVQVLKFSPSRDFLKNLPQVTAAIKKTRPALVHTFDELPSNTAAVLAAKLAGAKCVCQLMGENPLRKKDLPFAWMADKLVCVSEAVRRHYFKYVVPKKNFVVIPHGTNVAAFDPSLSGERFRERHGLHRNDLVVSSPGRLEELKGLDYFLRAAALVARQVPNARLGIASKTVFTGQVRKIDQLFAASDVVVQASTWREAFSNVLLEACAMGKPCVATAVGGNPEIVGSPEVGRVVPPKDAERMAEALVE